MKIQTLERKVLESRIGAEMRKCTEISKVPGNEMFYRAEFLTKVSL
jgi:hypothetical protein